MGAQERPTVRIATPADGDAAVAAITRAFSEDPAGRWLYADAERYHRFFPEFIRAFGGRGIDAGTAWCSADLAGAALWLAPGTEPDEAALDALLERTVPPCQLLTMGTVLEQMGRHHPQEPHWYLPLIGVDPARQGGGIGSALMAAALAAIDRSGLPAYLESTSARNVSLYERHGFRTVGMIEIEGAPPIRPMLRPARG